LFPEITMHVCRLTTVAFAAFALVACSTPTPTATPTRPVAEASSLPAPPPPPVMPAPAAQEAIVASMAMQAAPESRSAAMTKRMAPAGALAFAPTMPQPAWATQDRERYAHLDDHPVHRAAEHPVSTFSVDVDTGSYANVRRFLNQGQLPPGDAVRVEELINYFPLTDAPARSLDVPFAVRTELATAPWNERTRLLRIGIQSYRPAGAPPPSNLVFLVDVSGSMNSPDKLPLVQASLKLLANQLRAEDRISLVTYAGATAVVLEPTAGDQRATIEQAIDRLSAGGGTAGGAGIQLAYQQAEKAYLKNGNNRILLATDGDFNIGVTRFEALVDLVKQKRKTGIALTTLGFGSGNYNERLMEQIADAGDGNYSYIDSLLEAQKVLVAQREATLLTIAQDVKIQVEFNPAVVSEYRLIGYENRALRREDFSNDAVDAGDIGAGHSVTALYEVALQGEGGERMEPLRYAAEAQAVATTGEARRTRNAEVAFVRLRYKRPGQTQSRLIESVVPVASAKSLSDASAALRLTAAVAAFGQKLKGGQYLGDFGYPQIAALAREAAMADASGSAGELVKLVGLAESLSTPVDRRVSTLD
jgi:Ca-activated chloride channel family protein